MKKFFRKSIHNMTYSFAFMFYFLGSFYSSPVFSQENGASNSKDLCVNGGGTLEEDDVRVKFQEWVSSKSQAYEKKCRDEFPVFLGRLNSQKKEEMKELLQTNLELKMLKRNNVEGTEVEHKMAKMNKLELQVANLDNEIQGMTNEIRICHDRIAKLKHLHQEFQAEFAHMSTQEFKGFVHEVNQLAFHKAYKQFEKFFQAAIYATALSTSAIENYDAYYDIQDIYNRPKFSRSGKNRLHDFKGKYIDSGVINISEGQRRDFIAGVENYDQGKKDIVELGKTKARELQEAEEQLRDLGKIHIEENNEKEMKGLIEGYGKAIEGLKTAISESHSGNLKHKILSSIESTIFEEYFKRNFLDHLKSDRAISKMFSKN